MSPDEKKPEHVFRLFVTDVAMADVLPGAGFGRLAGRNGRNVMTPFPRSCPQGKVGTVFRIASFRTEPERLVSVFDGQSGMVVFHPFSAVFANRTVCSCVFFHLFSCVEMKKSR